MYELPTEIMIEGHPYRIRERGDYRTILGVFSVLEDEELEQTERIISALIIFYEDFNDIDDVLTFPYLEDAVSQMYDFFNGGSGSKGESGKKARKLIDWEDDSALICAAINQVAGKEIRSEPYLHWWTFLAYYMSVGECVLSTVVGIREKLMSGKPLEKWEREYRTNNPQYFNWRHKTVDELDAEEWLKTVWNKE